MNIRQLKPSILDMPDNDRLTIHLGIREARLKKAIRKTKVKAPKKKKEKVMNVGQLSITGLERSLELINQLLKEKEKEHDNLSRQNN